MATLWVTQSGTGGGTGADYANSIALASVTWAAGNTYYLADTITSIVAPTASGTSGNEIIIRGDGPGHPGQVVVSSGSAYTASSARDYIKLINLPMATTAAASAVLVNGNNVTVQGCAITSAKNGIEIQSSAARSNVVIDDNDIVCSSAAESGGVFLGANTTNAYNYITITNNRISNIGTTGSYGISLNQAGSVASARWTITGNVIGGAGGIGIRVMADASAGTVNDVIVRDNQVSRAAAGIRASRIRSSTSAYGSNFIAGNICTDNGPSVASGIEVVDCQYLEISGNDCLRQTTAGADGNGVLVGNGCSSVKVLYNHCADNVGSASDNSGCGVMVLSCPNVEVYGNWGSGNKHGLWLAGGDGTLTGAVKCNTFAGCSDDGAVCLNVVPAAAVAVTDNIFTGSGPYGFDRESGGAGGEQTLARNTFFGFTSGYRNQTAGTGDSMTDPALGNDLQAHAEDCRASATWVATVFGSDALPIPLRPDRGAVQDRNAAGRRFSIGGTAL
jgi:hypothetical protein